jgi:hypothetical protein
MKTLTFYLDDLDADAVRRAIARRQTFRPGGELLLPAGESDLAGALLAEVCRGWCEMIDLRPDRGVSE